MNMPPRENAMFSDEDIIDTARSVEPHDFDRIAPPPMVWDGILAGVEEEIASQEATARSQSASWFGSARFMYVAAGALLIAGLGVAALSFRGNDTPAINVTEVAAAMLTDEGLPVSTTETANASFVCEGDVCFVDIDLTALPDAGADDLELWVINGDVTDMHSLGLVTENDGRFQLPANVTAQDFPIVDISIEPDDGDVTHSGQSVLRGVLTET